MKKSKLLAMILLVLLSLSAAGCLLSFAYVSWQDIVRQNRRQAFRDFEHQEKTAQVLEKEYRDWQKLPLRLQEFRDDHILSLEEFAAFRRSLDSRLAVIGLRAPRIALTFGNKQRNIRKVVMKFSLEGSYRDLKKFICDMEAEAKMLFFSNIQLSAAANAVKGVFILEVYLGE